MIDYAPGYRKEPAGLSDEMRVRREKLFRLQDEDRNPYAITKFERSHYSADIVNGYDALEAKNVRIAGRIMAKRVHGKAGFLDVQDDRGRVQVYVSIDDLGDQMADVKTWDVGDIIGAEGFVFKTKTETVSVHVKSIELLSKSLRPLPEKFHGMTDTELRYRRRYVDLIMNPESRKVFELRINFIRIVRRYLDERGYYEVETPVLGTILGGANARPFITHHNTLDIDMYLRIATELNLKRLIVGGLERVYEIGRIFRNEGMDTKHNPEFTTVELYESYADFNTMMDITEGILTTAAKELRGTYNLNWMGHDIDLTPGWRRLTMIDAVKEYVGIDFNAVTDAEEACKMAEAAGVDLEGVGRTWGEALYESFDQKVEEKLIQPTFITMYPVEVSPLAKRSPEDPRLTERFECFICACEMGNAFSELNDPLDQRIRFERQAALKAAGNDEATDMDVDFCEALEYGMPPTGGLGIGIDRSVMMLAGTESIRDVILFPTMKPLESDKPAVKAAVKKENKVPLKSSLSREAALELLKKYNQDSFHIRHALTVEGVMRWFAKELGYGEEEEFWGLTGLLHDIDFELYPEEHCKKAPELLREGGVSEEMIHAICSHGYGLCSDVEPALEMEKVLFAADELTGLIWSYALMRPDKSCEGMELKSLKKKFKDKKFAAGCSRDVIMDGAAKLGWELDDLMEKTISAMQSCEKSVAEAMGD